MQIFETIKNLFLTKNIRNKDNIVSPLNISSKESTSVTHDIKQIESDSELYSHFDPFSIYSINMSNSNLSSDELIRCWRSYSIYQESINCLDDVVGEAINRDAEGDFLNLDLSDVETKYEKRSSQRLIDEIRYSYDKFNLLTEFDDKVEDYFRQFYVDGSLNAEVIYPKDDKQLVEQGIIDCQILSPIGLRKVKIRNPKILNKDEFINYNKDYLIGTDTADVDLLYGNMEKEEYKPNREYTFFYYDKTASPTNNIDGEPDEQMQIIFDEEQLISANSGSYNPEKKIYLSYMNKSIRALRSLYMVEDAILVYRMSHSSAKRVFNLDVKKMNRKDAEKYLTNLMEKYSSKMFYNASDGTISNYNTTRSIGTENYWFLKNPDGSKSVEVETLDALTNFEITNMADLDYFIRKVKESFGTPVGRADKANSQTSFSYDSNNMILREELRFSKMVTSYKRKFIQFIYEFIMRDLIARRVIGMDDWYDVKKMIKFRFYGENDFLRKQRYSLLAQQVELSDRLMSYVTEHKFFSKKWLKNTIWEMSEEDIKEQQEQIELETIEENLRQEEQEQEVGDFESGGGRDLGSGYDSPFEPLPPEMGNVSDDVFPDFESPEEAPEPMSEPEELTSSIPQIDRTDLIFETMNKIKDKIKDGTALYIEGIEYIKKNGLFVEVK